MNMLNIENKFCDALISNNVKLFDKKKNELDNSDLISEYILHLKKIYIINNPKIICDYIKDQYFKNVLAIKYKGQYLYKMLFAEHNKMLWDYLFDETKILFFLYREVGKNNSIQQLKLVQPRGNFNMLMKNIEQYFYQTAPDTELGDHLTKLKDDKKLGCFHKNYFITLKQRWIKKRKWNNKMEADSNNWIKDFNDTFKNFNYICLKGRTPYFASGVWTDLKGTHFDYLFNLKKNCLVWDCNKDDFRKERIDDYATQLAYNIIGEEALDCVGKDNSLQKHFDYIKKEYGFHFLYNVAKNNMERWWRDKYKCWTAKGKCEKCNCDVFFRCQTKESAEEINEATGLCKKCMKGKFIEFYPNDSNGVSDSDSGVSDSDSD